VQALAIKFVGIVTKAGYKELPEVFSDIHTFFNELDERAEVGIRLLSAVVMEFSSTTHFESLVNHRKASTYFKDKQLNNTFAIAVKMIKQGMAGKTALLEPAMELSYNCLNFDFIGISPDESTDDPRTLHLPPSWREYFEGTNKIHELFFELYSKTSPPLSNLVFIYLFVYLFYQFYSFS
jgi:exportin-7